MSSSENTSVFLWSGYTTALRITLVCVLAGVFLYAAHFKILDPAEFARSIRNYRILPLSLVNLTAIILPWWEVAAAVALFFPSLRKPGALLTLLMGLVFMGAVISAMVRGLDIECGCFGQQSSQAGIQTLLVDIGIVVASVGLIYLDGPGRDRGLGDD